MSKEHPTFIGAGTSAAGGDLISSSLILSSFFVSFSFIFKVQLHLNLSIVSPLNGGGETGCEGW